MNLTPPHFKTPAFEGPLDLLLHLIRANQVDISDIPIAEITDQYLAMMHAFEALDLQAAGEYVLLAATLIEIKSRMLLPRPLSQAGEDIEEDPRAELVARLREYELYQGPVETLRSWEEMRRGLYFRGAARDTDDYILPMADGEATPIQLYQAGVGEKPVTAVIPRRRLNLRLKMAEILRKVNRSGPAGLSFEALFLLPCPRYDIVLTFLAMLELVRIPRVRVKQPKLYGDILLFGIAPVDQAGATT